MRLDDHQYNRYLTIIRRRRGDYRGIFAGTKSRYSPIITEPEANNCFSIFEQAFCVFGTEFILILRISLSVLLLIDTDVLLFFTEFCLYNKYLTRSLRVISHSFAALTREIPCSTLEINLVFPRTHVLFSLYIYI